MQASLTYRLPHFDRPVTFVTEQKAAIGTECDSVDQALIAAQRSQTLASFTTVAGLPEFDSAIGTATGQHSIGTERDGPDDIRVSVKCIQAPSGYSRLANLANLPEFDSAISTATGQYPLLIKGHKRHYVRMSNESIQLPAAAGLPHPDRAIISSAHQPLTIRAKRQRLDR